MHTVWLASYPRSGNTLVRILLANYFLARFEPLSLHALQHFNFGEHIQGLWQQVIGKSLPEVDEPTQWLSRPAYFKALRATTPPVPRRFIKTHTLNCTRWGVPAFHFRPSDRIIYVARSPADVVISLAAFHGWDIGHAKSHLLNPVASLHHPDLGHEVTGSWNLHVNSWAQNTDCPVLVVPFSQLRADPATWLVRMLTFIDAKPNLQHVQNCVKWTRFDSLQEQEARHGFPEAPRGENRQPFFRAGLVGQWQDILIPQQVEKIVNACATGMKLIGDPVAQTGQAGPGA